MTNSNHDVPINWSVGVNISFLWSLSAECNAIYFRNVVYICHGGRTRRRMRTNVYSLNRFGRNQDSYNVAVNGH